MKISSLLQRVEGVRQSRTDQWMARCPAHADLGPSLAIRATDDGRILLHCFAGCPVEDVVAAIELTLADLAPKRPLTPFALRSKQVQLRSDEALDILGHEIVAAALILDDIGTLTNEGTTLNRKAVERIALAAFRISKVRSLVESRGTPEIMAIRRGVP